MRNPGSWGSKSTYPSSQTTIQADKKKEKVYQWTTYGGGAATTWRILAALYGGVQDVRLHDTETENTTYVLTRNQTAIAGDDHIRSLVEERRHKLVGPL